MFFKNFHIPDVIEETTKYLNYRTGNNFVLSGINLGLANRCLLGKVKKSNITKDRRAILPNINAYLQCQLSDKLYAITAGNNLTSLNITNQLQ